jgi:hypothetical protein
MSDTPSPRPSPRGNSGREWVRRLQEEFRRRDAEIGARRWETRRRNDKNRAPAPKDFRPAVFYVSPEADLDKLLGPAKWYGAYLLNLIHTRSSWWRHDVSGFVRLKVDHLRKVVPAQLWSRVRDTLVGAGVVEWDKTFDKGKCQGYRLRPEYRQTRRVACTNDALSRKIAAVYAADDRKLLPVHRWLVGNLARLEVDTGRAEAIIDTLKPRGSGLAVAEHRQRVRDQVTMLANGDYRCTVCRFGRFHTPITRLPRELRCCLSAGGTPLVNVDLANSQPLIFGVLARDWLAGTASARHRLRHMPFKADNPYGASHRRLGGPGAGAMSGRAATRVSSTNQSNKQPNTSPHPQQQPYYDVIDGVNPSGNREIRKGPSETPPADFRAYMAACQAGTFYESLMTEAEKAKGKKARDRLKVRFYRILFGRKKTRRRYRNELRQRFRRLYPTAANVLTALKARNYRHSSHVLQNTEATVFIYRVCGRFMRERPDAFVATIHDSILTTPDNVEYVETVIRDEFARLGVTPTLKQEIYAADPDNTGGVKRRKPRGETP